MQAMTLVLADVDNVFSKLSKIYIQYAYPVCLYLAQTSLIRDLTVKQDQSDVRNGKTRR